MATQELILEQDTTEESAGRMGPRENVRALPRVLKKKLTLPITGEVDLPKAVREAMEYRVEVIPLVLDEGLVLARSELKPGEKPIAYTVLRRGNDLDDLNPQFSTTIDRERFDARKDPQALEKALEKAQALALRILLIVGTDSGDRGHPWRGNILVVVILSTGGHDGSTLGAVPGSR